MLTKQSQNIVEDNASVCASSDIEQVIVKNIVSRNVKSTLH